MSEEKINVEVAYALPQKQKIIALVVEPGTTALEAAKMSNINSYFEGINVSQLDMGVFGKSVKQSYVLRNGDRVELYRPLIADPKEVRKQRAAKAKSKA